MSRHIAETRSIHWGHLLLFPFTLLTLVPALWVIKMAFRPSQSFDLSLNPIPTELSLENFRALIEAPAVARRVEGMST